MTEEEMREKIVSLESENKDFLDKYNTVSEQIKVKDFHIIISINYIICNYI